MSRAYISATLAAEICAGRGNLRTSSQVLITMPAHFAMIWNHIKHSKYTMATKKVTKATFQYGGAELSLTKSKTKAAIRYAQGMQPLAKKGAKKKSGPDNEKVRDFEVVTSARGIDAKLDKLRAQPDVSVGTHIWYMDDEDDIDFIPTGYLYIEFKDNTSPEKQDELLEEFGLNVREIIGPHAFRVNTTAASPNPIKCAISLQRKKAVLVAEPEFVTKPVTNGFMPPSGQFIGSQWHLENTGQAIPAIDVPNSIYGPTYFKRGADAKVKEAWSFLQNMGSSTLKIAVIDTGFDTDHPQLRGDGAKVKNAFNAVNRSADTSPWFQASDGSWGVYSHGTSCAAVALGALDHLGVLGAAPNSRFIPIKLDVLSDDAIVKAFEHALMNGVDIISCSLGFPKPVPLSTWVTNTISKVAREGRAGKGMPIFIAAGNANPASNNLPRLISDFATHPDIICITASNSLDEHSSYSFFGPNAFMCAPTNGNNGVGITTATVEVGPDGRSLAHKYTSGFGGTSSAAPLSAGICALMLTANPNLSLSQIKTIFKQSTDKIVGGYDANGHSQYLGFGRVNALKAVQKAAELAGGANLGGATTSNGSSTVPVTPPPANTQRGKVISAFVNVRSGPATTFAKVAELHQGDIVPLIEKSGAFWRIGPDQFVNVDYIQVLAAGSTAPVTTRKGKVFNTPTVNVRSGPSVANPKVLELKQGAVVTIYETSKDGWHRIGNNQWVLGKYIQII